MGLFDFFRKRKAANCDGQEDLTPEEFEESAQRYSRQLANAFESVTCQRPLADDPAVERLLHKSGLMRHVPDWPMPSSAIVFPRADEDNEIVYGYTWELIESLSTEELGLELLEQLRGDIAAGKIG